MTAVVEFMVAAAVLPLAALDRFSLLFCAVWIIYYLTAAIWLKASFIRPRQEPHDLVLHTARPFVFSNVLYVVIFANPFILYGILSLRSAELNTFLRLFGLALAVLFLWLACVATDYLVMRVLPEWSVVRLQKYRFSVSRLLWTNGCVILLALLLGLLVAIVPGTNALMSNGQAVNAVSWKSVINDYVTWSREFHENVGEVQKDDWMDAGLGPALNACKILNYPINVAKASRLDPTDMEYEDWLSDSLRDRTYAPRVQEAQQAADTLRSFLTVGTENAWPVLDRVNSAANQLRNYESSNAAGFLDDLIKAVEPPDAVQQQQMIRERKTVDIVTGIKSILQLKDSLAGIAGELDKIKDIEKSIADIDTKLQPFAAAVAEELKNRLKLSDQGTVAAVKKINDILNSFKPEARSLGEEIKTIDAVVFGKDYDKGLEGMSFEDVKKISKAYQPIDYPSNKDKTAVLDRIETSEGKLRSVIQNPMLTDEGNKCRAELEQLKSVTSGFRADCENKGLYFVARNNEKIEEAWQIVLSKLLSRENELIRLVQLNEPPGEYFAKCMEFIKSFSESDAIRKDGLERFNQIKARFVKAGGSDNSAHILYDPQHGIYRDCEDLKKTLAVFDEKRKQLDAKINAITADKFDSAGVEATKLRQSYVLAREALFTRTLPPAFEKPLPAGIDKIDAVRTFDSNIDGLIHLLDHIAVLNAHLADFYLLNEDFVVGDRSVTLEAYAADFNARSSTLQKSSIGVMFEDEDSNLSRACDAIENTIASLKKIEKSNDSAEIIRLGGLNETTPVAQGSNRVLVRSAWKKLQSAGFDPGKTISAQTVSNLEKWYAGSGRKKMLVDDLRKSTADLYEKFIDNLEKRLGPHISVIQDKGAAYDQFQTLPKAVAANLESARAQPKPGVSPTSLNNSLREALKHLEEYRQPVSKLAALLNDPAKWNDDNYHISEFARAWEAKNDGAGNITNLAELIEHIAKYENYKRPDELFWEDVTIKLAKVDKMNKAEKKNTVTDDLKGFQDKTFPEAKNDAIESNKNKIRLDLIEKLQGFEDRLIPVFCKNLQWSETENGVVFTDLTFSKNYEVVVLQGIDESSSYSKKKDKWSVETDWNTLKSRDQGKTLQDSFFADFNPNKRCWPKYIRSKEDSSVILRYIPADDKGKPFYMSIRETTYEQFNKFLKVHLNNNWDKDSVYKIGRILIVPEILTVTGATYYWTGMDAIKNFTFDETDKTGVNISHKPIVWVTFNGAKKYCSWLGEARLPGADEHRQASVFLPGDKVAHFASNDNLELFWNNYCRSLPMERREFLYPWGIIHKVSQSSGDSVEVDVEKADALKKQVFPRVTSISPASKQGIHDLIGNVWEWCTDDKGNPAVCGYSCLTPEEFRDEKHYILHGSGTEGDYKYEVEPYCDVGFRVVVDLPEYAE